MLSKWFFSFVALSLAVGVQASEISIQVSADNVKEVKIISDDKKSATVYAVEKVDPRIVDGTLLKNPDSPETKKIRDEIKADVMANGQKVEKYTLNEGDIEKLQTESQFWWNRWARRAWRRSYWWGGGWGGGCGWGAPICAPVYYAPPPVFVAPPPVVVAPPPVVVQPWYGFYGAGDCFGVFIN